MPKGEWKKIVNDKVEDKEYKEWTATSLLYRRLKDFKSTSINLKTGCPWLEGANRNCSLLWKINVMWKLLVTNKIKSGYMCNCFSTTF